MNKTYLALTLVAIVSVSVLAVQVGARFLDRGYTVIEDADSNRVLLDKQKFEEAAINKLCPVFVYDLIFDDDFQAVIDEVWDDLDRELRRADAFSYADQSAYYADHEEKLFQLVSLRMRNKFSLKASDDKKWKSETLLPEA